MRCAVLTLVLAALACGDKKDGKRATGKASARPDPKAALAEVAATALPQVNALVPPALAGKLEFTAVLGEKDRHVAVVPKGWETGTVSNSSRPPDAAGLGFMTQIVTGASCDGPCEPKDWPASAERADFAPLTGPDYTILRDDKQPDRRVVVAKTVDRTYVVAATWKPGAKRYFVCHATLDQEIAAAAPAFEAACRALRVVAWD